MYFLNNKFNILGLGESDRYLRVDTRYQGYNPTRILGTNIWYRPGYSGQDIGTDPAIFGSVYRPDAVSLRIVLTLGKLPRRSLDKVPLLFV